jgi:hypothetical protein
MLFLVGLEIFGQKKPFPFWKGFYHFGEGKEVVRSNKSFEQNKMIIFFLAAGRGSFFSLVRKETKDQGLHPFLARSIQCLLRQ